jgi:hypothetical protein
MGHLDGLRGQPLESLQHSHQIVYLWRFENALREEFVLTKRTFDLFGVFFFEIFWNAILAKIVVASSADRVYQKVQTEGKTA